MNPLRRLSDRWRRERRTGLNHHIPMPEGDPGFDRITCTRCVWRDRQLIPCDLHDERLWDSLERRYHQ